MPLSVLSRPVWTVRLVFGSGKMACLPCGVGAAAKGAVAPLDAFRARPKAASPGIAAAKVTRWMNCAARVEEMRYNSIRNAVSRLDGKAQSLHGRPVIRTCQIVVISAHMQPTLENPLTALIPKCCTGNEDYRGNQEPSTALRCTDNRLRY